MTQQIVTDNGGHDHCLKNAITIYFYFAIVVVDFVTVAFYPFLLYCCCCCCCGCGCSRTWDWWWCCYCCVDIRSGGDGVYGGAVVTTVCTKIRL